MFGLMSDDVTGVCKTLFHKKFSTELAMFRFMSDDVTGVYQTHFTKLSQNHHRNFLVISMTSYWRHSPTSSSSKVLVYRHSSLTWGIHSHRVNDQLLSSQATRSAATLWRLRPQEGEARNIRWWANKSTRSATGPVMWSLKVTRFYINIINYYICKHFTSYTTVC